MLFCCHCCYCCLKLRFYYYYYYIGELCFPEWCTVNHKRRRINNSFTTGLIQTPREPIFYKLFIHTKIQGSLFASDMKMYIGICLGDVTFTRKQYV